MYLLKKIIAPFFMPVSGLLFLALAGLFCLWFTRKQKTGKVFGYHRYFAARAFEL